MPPEEKIAGRDRIPPQDNLTQSVGWVSTHQETQGGAYPAHPGWPRLLANRGAAGASEVPYRMPQTDAGRDRIPPNESSRKDAKGAEKGYSPADYTDRTDYQRMQVVGEAACPSRNFCRGVTPVLRSHRRSGMPLPRAGHVLPLRDKPARHCRAARTTAGRSEVRPPADYPGCKRTRATSKRRLSPLVRLRRTPITSNRGHPCCVALVACPPVKYNVAATHWAAGARKKSFTRERSEGTERGINLPIPRISRIDNA